MQSGRGVCLINNSGIKLDEATIRASGFAIRYVVKGADVLFSVREASGSVSIPFVFVDADAGGDIVTRLADAEAKLKPFSLQRHRFVVVVGRLDASERAFSARLKLPSAFVFGAEGQRAATYIYGIDSRPQRLTATILDAVGLAHAGYSATAPDLDDATAAEIASAALVSVPPIDDMSEARLTAGLAGLVTIAGSSVEDLLASTALSVTVCRGLVALFAAKPSEQAS